MFEALVLTLALQEAPRPVVFQDLPPAVRLGLRVEAVRRARAVIPAVVLVNTPQDFARAIARWTPSTIFPVLLDDGTLRAREDIARFVRAFEPARVVRWDGPADHDAHPPLPDVAEWADDAGVRRGFIEAALARSWGLEGDDLSSTALLARWKTLGHTPPGIVLASDRDGAWTAALTLAAARGQPLAWATARGAVDAALQREAAAELARQAEAACQATGLEWRALGDDLDAVTLAMNAPVKIRSGEQGFTATTDRLGRHPESPSPEGVSAPAERWAWAGHVFGSEAEAAYRAMSAVFLTPRRAWLFDAYPNEGDWAAYDATAAADVLRRAGLAAEVHDTPRQGIDDWRAAAARPLDAGLVMVNTKGMRDFFELEPGRGRSGDAPMLRIPAMVYFVHSFSCVQPANRETLAGRWIERGAYAYVGSVHEPYLGAFVPTPLVATRLQWGYPWAAATRVDTGPEWRVAVIGDPLIVTGSALKTSPDPLPFSTVTDLAEDARAAVLAKDYARALSILTLLGRDDDAVRLAAALLKDEPRAFDADLASQAILPAARAGRADIVIPGIERLDTSSAAPFRDALWSLCTPLLPGTRDDRLVNLLRVNLRDDQAGADAILLSRAVARLQGVPAAVTMLESVKARLTDRRDLAEIDRALSTLRR